MAAGSQATLSRLCRCTLRSFREGSVMTAMSSYFTTATDKLVRLFLAAAGLTCLQKWLVSLSSKSHRTEAQQTLDPTGETRRKKYSCRTVGLTSALTGTHYRNTTGAASLHQGCHRIKLTMNLQVITLKKTFTKEVRQNNRQISYDSVAAVFNGEASVVGVVLISQGHKLILHREILLLAYFINFILSIFFHSIKFYITVNVNSFLLCFRGK